ncbi:MAG: polymerase sigma-B factor [Micromonosporaceae bacterium]|nr:polymerase sigma-B factor [Micromonosporaceae bacterium]
MRIDVRRLGEADLAMVEGSLDLATTPRLRAVLDARLEEGRCEAVLDLWKVKLLDAGAAGMLVGVADRAERGGGALRAVGARGIVLEVLQIVGLDKRFSAYDEPSDILDRYAVDLPEAAEYYRQDVCARWPGSRDITVHGLLSAAMGLPADSPDRAALRKQAIEDNIAFAQRLARRFRDRGEPADDLAQVALVGLVNAVDGYDPRRGCEFAGYATPTIVGEVRRYFRDKGWRIKVPRRLQELRLQVNRAKVELSQTMSASPTNADIARHLGVSDDDVAEAIEVARLYHPVSLSAPAGPDTDLGVADPIGDLDPGMEAVENRESVKPLLASLPERERRILTMRFFGDMTQSQIATELGISQMHVSRLLSQTLVKLRTVLTEA